MTTENKSFVLRGINDVEFEERPVPEVGDDEALIEVKKTGICGSDVHYLLHGRIGDFIVDKPMVLGHESAGIVSKVGKKVTHLKPGARVAIEPGATCKRCPDCKSGRYELCPHIVFAATPPYDGTLGRYYSVPADLAYELPDNLTLEDGAMMEPLSVAVHAVNTLAQVRSQQTVAIFGAGPVGVLSMAVAKALGAKRVIAIDINKERLELAKKAGVATDTYVPPSFEKDEAKIAYSKRAVEAMRKEFGIEDRGDHAVDTVFDASGAEVCIQMAFFLAKTGGTFVQVGMGTAEVTVPITLALIKELTIKGSFRYGPGDYPMAISLVAQGKIDLKPFVTHRFAFADAVNAFESTKKGRGPDDKLLVKAIISGPDVDPKQAL